MNVLFVCMGNICRSPAAEGIFRALAQRAGLDGRVRCASAGIIDEHAGEPADPRMRAAAAARGYPLTGRARQVRSEDFHAFDHIIAMDRDNYAALAAMADRAGGKARLSMMCDYARRHAAREVPDPYYGGPQGFERVLDLLEDACAGLLETLTVPPQRDGGASSRGG